MPRNIYLVFYFGLMGAYLYGYVRWSALDLKKLFSEHWAGVWWAARLSVSSPSRRS